MQIQVVQLAALSTPPMRLPHGYVTVADAARYLGVAPETVRRWIDSGRLHAKWVPGGRHRGRMRWLIPTDELAREALVLRVERRTRVSASA